MVRCKDRPRGLSRGQKQDLLGSELLTEVEATIGASLSSALVFRDDLGGSRSIDSNNGICCTVLADMHE
jgi:hypothetical protein